jgi:hypothetical protein
MVPLPDRTPSVLTTSLIALIDLSIITGIIVIGQFSHQINPLADLLHSFLTYAPFYTGWILTAPVFGAYHRSTLTSYRNTLLIIGGAWIISVLIGGGLRATPYFPGQSPSLFLLVMTSVGLIGLLTWRITLTVFRKRYTPH